MQREWLSTSEDQMKKRPTKRFPIRLFKHVSRESEPKMGKGCGEGKEGASIESGKEPTEATGSIKHISTKENGATR